MIFASLLLAAGTLGSMMTRNGPYVIVEAENATVDQLNTWEPRFWNESLYSSTFSNTFVSRSRVLAYPVGRGPGTATLEIDVPLGTKDGDNLLFLGRYAAPYGYCVPFGVVISQRSGGILLEATLGRPDSPKIWAFRQSGESTTNCGPGLQDFCSWSWSSTENWVWEAMNVTVFDAREPLVVELFGPNNREEYCGDLPVWDAEVDVLMVTNNASDVWMRLEHEQQLPVDGVLSQANEVFAMVESATPSNPVAITLEYAAYHSAYSSQHLICRPIGSCVASSNGAVYSHVDPVVLNSSYPRWEEVGSLLGSFNDLQLLVKVTPMNESLPFSYEVTFRDALNRTIFATGTQYDRNLEIIFGPDLRSNPLARLAHDDILGVAKIATTAPSPPNASYPLQYVPIYGYTFCANNPNTSYFIPSEFGCSCAPQDQIWNESLANITTRYSLSQTNAYPTTDNRFSYVDLRGLIHNQTGLQDQLEMYVSENVADSIYVVSLGDEIPLEPPRPSNTSTQAFFNWCASQHLSPADVGCSEFSIISCPYTPFAPSPKNTSINGRLVYYSNLFAADAWITPFAESTALIQKYLPRAHVGANYAPISYSPIDGRMLRAYLGQTLQFVTPFRSDFLTLGWSEDYVWTTAQAFGEVMDLHLSLLRAGLDGTKRLMSYVMAHCPGNTPTSWKRMFLTAIKNGASMINLYELRPVSSCYTENYVGTADLSLFNCDKMYETVATTIGELSRYESIVANGTLRPASIGLYFSRGGDIWLDTLSGNSSHFRWTLHAEKRLSAIAFRHEGSATIDAVYETDLASLPSPSSHLLSVADPNVPTSFVSSLSTYLAAGGTAVFSACAAQYNEFNSSIDLSAFLGANTSSCFCPLSSSTVYPRQDLQFATSLGKVLWNENLHSNVYGCRSSLTVLDGTVRYVFDDGSPAVVEKALPNGGKTIMLAFMPGLSYLQPALPHRPADRGSIDNSSAHSVPTSGDPGLTSFIQGLTQDLASDVVFQGHISYSVIQDPTTNRTIVPFVNWDNVKKPSTLVRFNLDLDLTKAFLASGKNLTNPAPNVLAINMDIAGDVLVI